MLSADFVNGRKDMKSPADLAGLCLMAFV